MSTYFLILKLIILTGLVNRRANASSVLIWLDLAIHLLYIYIYIYIYIYMFVCVCVCVCVCMYVYTHTCICVCLYHCHQATSETIIVLGALQICEKRLLASLCLSSACMEQLGSHKTDFIEILLWIFRKSVARNEVWLKSDKSSGYFTWRPVYIYDHISLIS